MNFPAGIEVTLLSRVLAGSTDAYGNDAWTSTPTTVLAAFVPAGSTEQVQGRDTVTDTDTVYLPAGTVVAATDQIQIGADIYEIVGTPNAWVSPFDGWAPAIEVHLLKVSG